MQHELVRGQYVRSGTEARSHVGMRGPTCLVFSLLRKSNLGIQLHLLRLPVLMNVHVEHNYFIEVQHFREDLLNVSIVNRPESP